MLRLWDDLAHCPLWDKAVILKVFSNFLYSIAAWALTGTSLRWMLQNLTYENSALVQVMAWCHQATSHYLNQCWPRSISLYGVNRLQWVKPLSVVNNPKTQCFIYYTSPLNLTDTELQLGGVLKARLLKPVWVTVEQKTGSYLVTFKCHFVDNMPVNM